MNIQVNSVNRASQLQQKPCNKLPRFDYALAREIRVPLGHISLAIELLEISLWKNDQKIYVDVINRSTVRINDLLKDLLACQPADEIQAKIFIYQAPD